MISLDIKAKSDVGLVRSNNEDMILVGNQLLRDESLHKEINLNDGCKDLIAIADGMGGHNAGEIASEIVLGSLSEIFYKLASNLSLSAINEIVSVWLGHINRRLDMLGHKHKEWFGMGTTLVGLVLYETKIFWANCGDSRLYRWRDGALTQITTDHSLNNLTGVKGHTNIIVNCIGGGCYSSYLDFVEFSSDVRKDDVFILCSDGLCDMITDIDIERIISSGGSVDELCEAAKNAGGFDNISVCVVKVTDYNKK